MQEMQEMQEMWVQSLGWGGPLEEEMATHSNILAWKIPWTEDPGGQQSMAEKSQTRPGMYTRAHTQRGTVQSSAHLCTQVHSVLVEQGTSYRPGQQALGCGDLGCRKLQWLGRPEPIPAICSLSFLFWWKRQEETGLSGKL